jgi:hypothetical protein
VRLAHISLFGPDAGQCTGIINKLERNGRTAHEEALPMDFHTVMMESNLPQHQEDYRFVRIQVVPGRNPILTRIRQCRIVRDLLEQYDRAVLRYPSYDPICYLGIPQTDRIILEHHTREAIHLRKRSDPRWLMESYLGGRWIRRFATLTAITPEILDYEVERSGFTGPTQCFPDSTLVDACEKPVGPVWPGDTVRIALVVAREFPWYGLREIVDAIAQMDADVELHVAGHFESEMRGLLESSPRVFLHGHLRMGELAEFYRTMHVGIGSFNLEDGMGVQQSTPIKTREYLAHGLPVVYGHDDPGLPEEFPYHLKVERFDLHAILEFVYELRAIERTQIRETARPHIDARIHMQKLYDFCASV